MNLKMVIFFFLLFCWWHVFGQVAVIAHKSVPADTLKKSELLDFYTGDIKKWNANKQPIVVFDLQIKGEVKKTFYKFLGKSSSRMKSIWMKKILSGEGYPPEAMPTEAELLKKVAATPGAIGYVGLEKVNANVKILIKVNRAEKK